MSNFLFLQDEWQDIYTKMQLAEARINSEPDSTGVKCRSVLEQTLLEIYEIAHLPLPYEPTIHNMLTDYNIKAEIPANLMNGLFYVKKIGNAAAHGKKVMRQDAKITIEYMFTYLCWFARTYSEVEPETPSFFNFDLVPKVGSADRKLKELKEKLEKEKEKEFAEMKALVAALEKKNKAAEERANENEATALLFKEQTAKAKAALQERKEERHVVVAPPYTEAKTRIHLIDADLKEVGWDDMHEGRELEYKVTGMPLSGENPKGNGYADYVLWGDDGKPLAVIEAKRTCKEAEVGKHQAFLYANCLEAMHGQRPVIFYTNGYENYLWDDTFYSAPRRVHGFYTKEELQWLIQQRETRKDLRLAKVNTDIAGRYYQTEAIQRICESFVVDGEKDFRGARRKGLLVMATGSGKTRTAAALVELLMKNNWAKRVLFLADRTILVSQAKKSFGEHLKNVSSINLTQEKEDDSTRLVFSTYQSMVLRIDNVADTKERFYGVGHFDLIIIDEAHRSVYNKYKAIFDYFDALLVGLTATPKKHVDQNTYGLFDCEDKDPTYEFGLDEATPLYLNPFKVLEVETKFIKEGVKYEELSKEEQEKYEELFADRTSGQMPSGVFLDKVTSVKEEEKKILFNKNTVNKVLDSLMNYGLKIEGGDKIGKTIIFALNQDHAQFIVECFLKRYPDRPAGFIISIYNGISKAEDLIDQFSDEHKDYLPQIAVSVDMMDTGVDAPKVVNLVFFKPVKSYAKFWQMIGRGTRLSEDLFGPGKHKDHFVIFDVCGNFEYFSENPDGVDTTHTKTLTEQIFVTRLHLSQLMNDDGSDENLALAKDLLDILHNDVFGLDKKRFQVDMHLRYVKEFEVRRRWDVLSDFDLKDIEEHLAPLPTPAPVSEKVRRFDLLILKMQLAAIGGRNTVEMYYNKLIQIAGQLSTMYGVNEVLRKKDLIEKMKSPDFYKGLTQKRMEKLRVEIRELMSLLSNSSVIAVYSDFEDGDLEVKDFDASNMYGGNSALYKKRVERFIRENKHHIAISKLSSNEVITTEELHSLEQILFDGEERGTKNDFVAQYGEQPLGNFIRSIIGLDEGAARNLFADFLQAGKLRADQMTFINQIITYLTKNGTIEKKMLFDAPFTNVNDQGLFGVFDDSDVAKVIRIIDVINENAQVG